MAITGYRKNAREMNKMLKSKSRQRIIGESVSSEVDVRRYLFVCVFEDCVCACVCEVVKESGAEKGKIDLMTKKKEEKEKKGKRG